MRRASIAAALPLALLIGACAPTAPPSNAPGGGADGLSAAAFPTTPPTPGPAPTITLPAPERRSLASGLEVLYVRHGGLPLVHATLLLPAGSISDPAELPGLASFTAAMLDEGAGGRDALELAAALELIGASLATGAGLESASVDLAVLRTRLPEALELMADVVARPDFPEEDLRRLRDQRITALAAARDESGAIASNAFAALVFGESHPYGRLPTTTAAAAMDRAALTNFHGARYRPAGSTLILVGDVDAAELHPVVEQAFGGWHGEAPAAMAVDDVPPPAATRIYLIDKPGAAQSEIRLGHPAVSRDDPDYFPILVLNTILGGSFTSRLNTNLRETHGYSYGAGSTFAMRLGRGPFQASSAVFTAATDSSVVEFFNELRRIREEPVPADELERAKQYVALGLPRRFETVGGIAGQLAELELHGLSMEFYNSYVADVMNVSVADVQRVARQHLHPDRTVVVVVGDRAEVEAGLRGLPVGEVELRRTDEFVR